MAALSRLDLRRPTYSMRKIECGSPNQISSKDEDNEPRGRGWANTSHLTARPTEPLSRARARAPAFGLGTGTKNSSHFLLSPNKPKRNARTSGYMDLCRLTRGEGSGVGDQGSGTSTPLIRRPLFHSRFVLGDWWRLPESPRPYLSIRLRRPCPSAGDEGLSCRNTEPKQT